MADTLKKDTVTMRLTNLTTTLSVEGVLEEEVLRNMEAMRRSTIIDLLLSTTRMKSITTMMLTSTSARSERTQETNTSNQRVEKTTVNHQEMTMKPQRSSGQSQPSQ